jgi:hypothetical protein
MDPYEDLFTDAAKDLLLKLCTTADASGLRAVPLVSRRHVLN